MANATSIVLVGVTVVFILLGPWIVPLFGLGFDPATGAWRSSSSAS